MYIIDHDRQLSLIKEMKQLRRDTQKYEVYYHHPHSNQMWKSFFPRSNGDDLGPKLLRHEPVPNDINELLDICLTEDVSANATGLGIEWSAHTNLWPDIIKVLEQNYSSFLRGQLKLFLEHLNMGEVNIEDKEKASVETESMDTGISGEELDNLIWRSRKIRMKRFFVLG